MIERSNASWILAIDDSPGRYGEVWAQEIAEGCRLPTVVVSTTADTKARELMFRLLSMAGVQVTNCYADHQGCETEWLWWLRGVTGIR